MFQRDESLIFPLILALAVHLLLYFVEIKPIVLPEKVITHVRIVGKEEGKKDTIALNPFDQQFNSPKPNNIIPKASRMDEEATPSQQPQKESKASSHHTPTNPLNLESIRVNQPVVGNNSNSRPSTALRVRGIDLPQMLQISGNPQLQTLSKSDLSVNFEIPEGVSEDELNQIEEVFYGFKKRTFTQYINSLIENLNEFERTYPHLRFPLTKDNVEMMSSVTIDARGNIVRINGKEMSNIRLLDKFFYDSLDEMVSIPNPPKALLNSNNELTISFRLLIKQR